MKVRSIYCPAHFGNFYECANKGEATQLFREWKKWGLNGVSTWFNPANVVDPFGTDPLYKWAREKPLKEWKRKRDFLLAAQELGFQLGLCIPPNAVYVDQLRPELAAKTGESHYIGPDLCPSQPGVRKIIARNVKNLFRFLKEADVRLDYILASFRDWGGCDCPKCRPWVKTAISLWDEELSSILLAYFPRAKVQFCSWWVSAEEMVFFQTLLAKKPKWVDGLNLSLGYTTDIPEIEIPAPYRKTIFLHISYSTGHSDKYGVKGAVVAPARLEMIFKKLVKSKIDGFQAYSEGIFEDLNKYLIGHLGVDPQRKTRYLVANYCQQYFGTDKRDTGKLVESIYRLEVLEQEPAGAVEISAVLEEIGRKNSLSNNWRYELLRVRAKVGELEWQIGGQEKWQKEIARLGFAARKRYIEKVESLITERRKVLEYLERYIYRTSNQCHCLNIDFDFHLWKEWKENRPIRKEKVGNKKFRV